MPRLLTPARQRGFEHLDDAATDPDVRRRSHRDIALSNVLFGGARAVLVEMRRMLPHLPPHATLLDVGSGVGDIPAQAAALAARFGVALSPVGLDCVPDLVRSASHRLPLGVCGDARQLPFGANTIDVVCCSQLLHHFDEPDALHMLREMHRVARRHVIVSDIRRSWIAIAGLWSASFPLRFHPISRHDGVVSIYRGFTTGELRELVTRAVGVVPDVRVRIGFRVTATWNAVTSRET